MQQGQQTKKNFTSMEPGFARTDAQKVKQEIQKDISKGQGAMTSREAGSLRE